MSKAWLISLILLLGGCTEPAEIKTPTPRLDLSVDEFGTYRVTVEERVPAEYSASGYISTVSAEHLKRTRQVELAPGSSFGFNFTLTGEIYTPVELMFVVEHPPMTDHQGEQSLGFTHLMTIEPAALPITDHFLYTLSEPYELVAGHWRLSIQYAGQELTRQPFTLIDTGLEQSKESP